jgi:anti-sigma factor RsiW/DNA-binding transcriptional regulator YhcF (GntR family)
MPHPSHPIESTELMAYLDGELPVERAATAAAHLERCPECQAIAADLRSVSQSLLAWQVEPAGAEKSTALTAALAARGNRRGWRQRMGVRPWVWGLAGVGLALLLVAMPMRWHRIAPGAAPGMPPVDVRRPLSRTFQYSHEVPPATAPWNATQSRLNSRGQYSPEVPAATAPATPPAPMVARTSALDMATREFDRARAAVDEILKRHHGYLGSLYISAPAGSARSLNATLRVPAADLEPALNELKQLGRVESEQQTGEEVSEQFVDLEARLANARNTEQRLTDVLRQRTGKLSDILDVEREVDRVRGEIERMEAEKKGLSKRVDYAIVNLTVTETYQARLEVVPDSTLGRIRNAAVEGYRNMIAGVVSLALFLATTAPTVLLWSALLFFPVRFAWRRWRKQILN